VGKRRTLSRKITVDVRGEILELKNTINTMVDQLNAFAGEVTSRWAREVGTEGKLGGQAEVPGSRARGKGLTDSVNAMATSAHGASAKTSLTWPRFRFTKGDLTRQIHRGSTGASSMNSSRTSTRMIGKPAPKND